MYQITKTVRKGRNNPFSLPVTYKGSPVDFSGASRFELTLSGYLVTENISGNQNGIITFNIQNESIPFGEHIAELVVFDAAHPEGQVIVDKYSDTILVIRFA